MSRAVVRWDAVRALGAKRESGGVSFLVALHPVSEAGTVADHRS